MHGEVRKERALVESERREVALKEKLGQQPVVINMDQQGATQEAQKRSSLRSVGIYQIKSDSYIQMRGAIPGREPHLFNMQRKFQENVGHT